MHSEKNFSVKNPLITASCAFLAINIAGIAMFPSAAKAESFAATSGDSTNIFISSIKNKYRHSALTFGPAIKSTTVNITNIKTGNSAQLSSDLAATYFVNIKTATVYMNNTNFGAYINASGSFYNASKNQDTENSLRGFYAYTGPVFFYQAGNRYKDMNTRIGLAPGLGAANYQGKATLNGPAIDEHIIISTPTAMAFQPVVNLLVETKWKDWSAFVGYSRYHAERSGYQIGIEEISTALGYNWSF